MPADVQDRIPVEFSVYPTTQENVAVVEEELVENMTDPLPGAASVGQPTEKLHQK